MHGVTAQHVLHVACLSLSFAGLASGGLTCGPFRAQCRLGIGSGDFISSRLHPDFTEDNQKQTCNRKNWAAFDNCHQTGCDMSLVITEPPELRMAMCAGMSSSRLSVTDVLGLELPVTSPPDPSGCNVSGWSPRPGSIAIINNGACRQSIKAQHMVDHNVTLTAIFSTSNENEAPGAYWGGKETRGINLGRDRSEYLLEHLARGTLVKGRLQRNCQAPAAEEAAYRELECPWVPLRRLCATMPRQEDRLCSRCPAELTAPTLPRPVCVYGNALLPRVPKNTLALPVQKPATDVVVMEVGACAEADFAGVSGKIVVVDLSTRAKCFPFGAVRAAERAGALAVMARVWRSDDVHGTQDVGELGYMLRGFSSIVNIPVHTINVADFEMLHTASLGSALVGRLRVLSADAAHTVSIAEGAFPPHPDTSGRAAVAEGSSFEWNSVTVPCVVIIVILFAVVVCVVARKIRQGGNLLYTGARGFSVPLAAWSLGLSLLLLAIVAVVAFVLADEAGKDATDTALADGKAAAQLTYRHAAVTAEQLSREVQNGVVSATLTNVKTFLTQGENWLDTTMPLFSKFDGTWESFNSQQRPVMGQYVNQKVDERLLTALYTRPSTPTDKAGWKVRIFGENGFYLCPDYKTDDRSDTQRGDGVVGNVSATNDGNLYGFQRFYLSSGYLFPVKSFTKTFLNISHQIGGTRGDPLSMVDDAGMPRWRARNLRRYHVTKRSFPGVEQLLAQPISIFKILYDRYYTKRGIMEVAVSLELFGRMLHWLNGEYKNMENLTALVYDKADESLIATNVWHNVKTYGIIYYTQSGITGYGSSAYDARSLYTVHDVPIVQINALGNYMRSPEWLASNVSGTFDQASHFTTYWITLFKIEAEAGGALRDTLETGHRAEVRGCGSGSCVAHDAARGRPVVHLDGTAALFVYHNLTTDAEIVRATRVSAPGSPWQSSAPEFNNIMTLSDGTECVTYNDEVIAGVPSPKCMAISTPFNTGVHELDKKSGDFSISLRVNPDETIGSHQWDDMPALFTDQPGRASAFERSYSYRESGITLYANGQFVMISEYALEASCVTQPLPGGLPRGVWTTITVTAETSFFSRDTGMRAEPADCRVYINGTLWSSMTVGRFDLSNEAHLRPYVFGAGLRGRLDDVMLFNKSLTANEAASVHRDGQVTPDVPPKEWLVSAGAHELSSSTSTGIDWTVVAMVPRNDVMREVDANARRTLHDLEVQDEETRRKLTRKRGEAALVLVVLGLGAALVFMLFNHMLTEPIKEVAAVIHKAAFLLVDDIPPTHSFIQEVNVIMRSVSVMFTNIKEYKSYLPMHVRAVAAHALETESSAMSEQGSAKSEGSLRSKRTTDSGTNSAKMSAAFVLAAPVVKKKVSLTLTNLLGYADTTKESPALCKSAHRAALEVLLPLFSKYRGMPESFTGDKFVCTFNASKPAADHRLAAARVALALQEESCDLSVNTALTTGNCRVGTLGTAEMMKLSVIGPIMQWVFVLERIGRVSGLATITDGAMREHLSLFKCCTRTFVRYPQLGSEMIELCAVLGENAVTTDEWMYQLAQAGNAFGPWNQFCSFVAHMRWSEAEDFPEEALAPALEHCSEVYAMFRDALHRKCPLSEAREGLVVTREGSKQRLQPMLETFAEFSSTHVHIAS